MRSHESRRATSQISKEIVRRLCTGDRVAFTLHYVRYHCNGEHIVHIHFRSRTLNVELNFLYTSWLHHHSLLYFLAFTGKLTSMNAQ